MPRRKLPSPCAEELELIRQLHEDYGFSHRAIAKHMDCSPTRVYNALRKLRVQLRPVGRPRTHYRATKA